MAAVTIHSDFEARQNKSLPLFLNVVPDLLNALVSKFSFLFIYLFIF